MNRRTKERLDLRLLCRIGSDQILSAPGTPSRGLGLTQNLSRSGLLLRWLDAVALPEVGSALTVDIELPADGAFGPRVMRCRTVVVRILAPVEGVGEGLPTVGLRIRNIRFVAPKPASQSTPKVKSRPLGATSSGAGSSPATKSSWELDRMAPASQRLN
jgi:hypothetical protein